MSPIDVGGEKFFVAAEIARDLGISRQTLWRWRKNGSVPGGRRYRDTRILFTQAEVLEIREFANRMEPAETGQSPQLHLFEERRGKK